MEDLLGYEFADSEGLVWKVTGSPSWSTMYVNVEATSADGEVLQTVRAASLLRRHKELDARDSTRSKLDQGFSKTYMP